MSHVGDVRTAVLEILRSGPVVATDLPAGRVLTDKVSAHMSASRQMDWKQVVPVAAEMERRGLISICREKGTFAGNGWTAVSITSAGRNAARSLEIAQHLDLELSSAPTG